MSGETPAQSTESRLTQDERRRLAELPRIARLITWPLVAIALIHTVFIGLWVAPSTPMRDWVGQERVREYVQPWFDQNWSIFAPNPRSVAVTFEVRASVEAPGRDELEITEWADLIDNEDAIIAGDPFPPRTDKIARRTADRLHTALRSMNSEQRDRLEANYTRTPVEELQSALLAVDGGAGPSTVADYMTADAAATRLASAFAETSWADDGEIVHVQYRTSTRGAPSWDAADGQTLDDAARSYRDYGWRRAVHVDEADLRHFREYLDRGGSGS